MSGLSDSMFQGFQEKLVVPFNMVSWLTLLAACFTNPSFITTSDIDAMHSVVTYPVQCKILCKVIEEERSKDVGRPSLKIQT